MGNALFRVCRVSIIFYHDDTDSIVIDLLDSQFEE